MRMRWGISIIVCLLIINLPGGFGEDRSDPLEDTQTISRDLDEDGFYVEICDWRWNRSGAVTLTFDDGLNSQAMVAAPLLAMFEFPGTFFVTIDNCNIPFGANWTDWQNVSDMGHEIGSHSISHPDLRMVNTPQLWDEVVLSRIILEENISGLDCETFSYPMGRYNSEVLELISDNYLSARMDSHNITGDPEPESRHPENLYSVVPCNFGSSANLSQMSDLVNETIESGGWLVEMIHTIGDGGYDPVAEDMFQGHLEYLDRMWKDLWVDTFVNVSKYIREREHSTIDYTVEDDEYLNISVTNSLGNDHNMPLTLEIDLPADWIDVDIIKEESVKQVSQYQRKAGEYRQWSVIVETEIGSTLVIRKNVSYPEILIGPYLWIEDNNSENGFSFVADYYSEIGRSTDFGMKVHFDLNDDGDTLDEVNGMFEGNHSMEYAGTAGFGPQALMYYFLPVEFPPGIHNPRFYFETYDPLDLHSREPSSGFFEGPFINNPPPAPGNISILDDHTRNPTINWSESLDSDGDNVTYHLSLFHNGSLIREDSTNDTSIAFDTDLEFDQVYNLEMNATDDLGAHSLNASFNFTLQNDPPDDPENLTVSNLHSFAPIFHYNLTSDPDGDTITIKWDAGIDLETMYDPEYQVISKRSFSIEINPGNQFDPMEHWFNINHTMTIQFMDPFEYTSKNETISFTPHNKAPPMIEWFNITYVDDSTKIINIDESVDPDGDPVNYEINISYRLNDEDFKEIPAGSFITNSTSIELVDFFIDGVDYRLNVTSVDDFGGRSSEYTWIFYMDPPPEPVVELSVVDREFVQGGVLLYWDYPYNYYFEYSGFMVYVYDKDPESSLFLQPIRIIDMERTMSAGIDNLEEGKEYWFTVTAYDNLGRESEKTNFIKGTPVDILPPLKPSNLRVWVWDNPYGCHLDWHQIPVNDLAGFLIYRTEGPPPPDISILEPIHEIMDGEGSDMSWFDTNISENRRYNYTIVSVDDKGNMDTEYLYWTEFSTFPEEIDDDDNYSVDEIDDYNPFNTCIFIAALVLANILVLAVSILIIKKRMEKGHFNEE